MKKIICVTFAVALIFAMCIPVFAAPADYGYVWDYADDLTESEEQMLDDALSELDESYAFPLFIISKYSNPEYTASEYAELFAQNNYDGFTAFGDAAGFIFVDDFDNNSFILYRVGDGDLIIDDEAVEALNTYLESGYDSEKIFATYSAVVTYVEDYCQKFSEADYVAQEQSTEKYDESYDYSAPVSNGNPVNDDAELLTDEQEAKLLVKIEALRTEYAFEIVLHTTNSIGDKTIADYADDYYDYNGFGVGENRDGLLFMLNMNNGEEGNRDYYTSTCGSGISVFTDYAIKDSDSKINMLILPFLEDGDWYGAFNKYLDLADIFLANARDDKPYDSANPYMTTGDYLTAECFVIVLAALAVFVTFRILRSRMKTNVKKSGAADYVVPGSLKIGNSQDIFSHKTVRKTVRPQETSSSSSGSSTHTSSSGTTHGGGGGKF